MGVTETVTEWGKVVGDSTQEFFRGVGDALPSIVGALIVFVVGLVVASVLKNLTDRVLSVPQVARVLDSKRIKGGLANAGVQWTLAELFGKLVYWVVVLIVLMSVANILGLGVLADTLQDLVSYVPNVLAAAIVIALTIAAARLVRDFVVASLTTLRASFNRTVGAVVQAIVVVFGVVTAVAQLGFDTTILTANITVLVAGVVFALALAFGLGGQGVARDIVEQIYANASVVKKPRR